METMKHEVKLSSAQRLEIERRCLNAIRHTELTYSEMQPAPHVKKGLVGGKGLIWTIIAVSIFSGITSLFLWHWIFELFDLVNVLSGFGLPEWLVWNLPAVLSIKVAGFSGFYGSYNWGVEGRISHATEAANAQYRSAILYSVIEELSDVLPESIPDLGHCAYSSDDSRPNPLIERALGRLNDSYALPADRRREPPMTR